MSAASVARGKRSSPACCAPAGAAPRSDREPLARQREVPVAYIPGLVMRRAADLYPGDAKTDQRDAYVIADTARTRRTQIHWLAIDDDLLIQLRVLNGLDVDLAADATRHANRLRDALSPAGVSSMSSATAGTVIASASVMVCPSWPD